MRLKELLKYIEHNQKVIIQESRWRELFRGTARGINLRIFGERNVRYIICDNDTYTPEYLKIEVEKE